MPDGGRDFMLATMLRRSSLGSAACIALAARRFSKLSAGLAGQDDGVTKRGPFNRPLFARVSFRLFFVCLVVLCACLFLFSIVQKNKKKARRPRK